jgi:Resolvase, N terminal domain
VKHPEGLSVVRFERRGVGGMGIPPKSTLVFYRDGPSAEVTEVTNRTIRSLTHYRGNIGSTPCEKAFRCAFLGALIPENSEYRLTKSVHTGWGNEGKIRLLRVSTDKQGQTGYGIDAQRAAVASYLNGGDWQLIGEFVEVESGKRKDRPELAKALAACRKHKARLVIAKLDRLARRFRLLRHAAGKPANHSCTRSRCRARTRNDQRTH